MEIDVCDYKGGPVKKAQLSPAVFEVPVKRALLHEVITAYRASIRGGNADTKTRAEVSGGGIKPWKQKGTGRARAGSIRSPLWRKGGIVFGPHPRSYEQQLPKAKIKAALYQALSVKAKSGHITVIDITGIFVEKEKPKTAKVAHMLRAFKAQGKKTLLIVDHPDERFMRASRNIDTLLVREAQQLHAYAVLDSDRILITEPALQILETRTSKENSSIV
jgi:large subunit ribosomal protein L4